MRCFIVIVTLALSCKDTPKVQVQKPEERLAKSLCDCTQELFMLNQRAERNADSLAFRAVAAEYEKARACALSLGVKPADRPAVDAAIFLFCPTLASDKSFLDELLKSD